LPRQPRRNRRGLGTPDAARQGLDPVDLINFTAPRRPPARARRNAASV